MGIYVCQILKTIPHTVPLPLFIFTTSPLICPIINTMYNDEDGGMNEFIEDSRPRCTCLSCRFLNLQRHSREHALAPEL